MPAFCPRCGAQIDEGAGVQVGSDLLCAACGAAAQQAAQAAPVAQPAPAAQPAPVAQPAAAYPPQYAAAPPAQPFGQPVYGSPQQTPYQQPYAPAQPQQTPYQQPYAPAQPQQTPYQQPYPPAQPYAPQPGYYAPQPQPQPQPVYPPQYGQPTYPAPQQYARPMQYAAVPKGPANLAPGIWWVAGAVVFQIMLQFLYQSVIVPVLGTMTIPQPVWQFLAALCTTVIIPWSVVAVAKGRARLDAWIFVALGAGFLMFVGQALVWRGASVVALAGDFFTSLIVFGAALAVPLLAKAVGGGTNRYLWGLWAAILFFVGDVVAAIEMQLVWGLPAIRALGYGLLYALVVGVIVAIFAPVRLYRPDTAQTMPAPQI